jgi:hypothetical protein
MFDTISVCRRRRASGGGKQALTSSKSNDEVRPFAAPTACRSFVPLQEIAYSLFFDFRAQDLLYQMEEESNLLSEKSELNAKIAYVVKQFAFLFVCLCVTCFRYRTANSAIESKWEGRAKDKDVLNGNCFVCDCS